MPGAAHNLDQEYWRPPGQNPSAGLVRANTELCPRCQTEFAVGARFCHVCGTERNAQPELSSEGRFTRFLDFRLIMDSLGLTVGALIAFIVGLACVLAAIVTGLIYTATTVLDWQAVQLWRMEWLLASIAAFVAGILLKRTS